MTRPVTAQLDQSGAADGDVVTWDDAAGYWRPAAPTGGGGALDDLTDVDTTGFSDGDVLTYDSGSSMWVPEAPTGGGGGTSGAYAYPIDVPPGSPDAWDYEFDATTTSLPSGWSWVNQGTSTYDEVQGGGAIYAPSSGASNLRCLVKAIPSGTTWTVVGKFTMHGSSSGVLMAGPILRSSSTSKIASFGHRSVGNVRGLYWTNPTTYASDITADVPFRLDETFYARIIKNSATSYDLALSADGVYWRTLAAAQNIAATTGTLDELGFDVCPENSAVAGITCHWFRKTA